MVELTKKVCTACRADAPPATAIEIDRWLPEIPNWRLIEEASVPKLSRTFEFADFGDALKFANEVGALADAEGHHPSLTIDWGKARVDWWTHAINGLHENDFIMAAKTDAVTQGTTVSEQSMD